MKKIGIITINDINNYGNRLQCYAVQCILTKLGMTNENIFNSNLKKRNTIMELIKNSIKYSINYKNFRTVIRRKKIFKKFNKALIRYSKYKIIKEKVNAQINKEYDYFIVGSDQVWNFNFSHISKTDLLFFADNKKRIAFAASFGTNEIKVGYDDVFQYELSKFKAISVREDAGKEIIDKLTGRKDVEVLIDPTMLLTPEEWDKVSHCPIQIDSLKGRKYILNYFLGNISEQRKQEIGRIAKENECEVINLLDKNDPFYVSGPSEFLWLEKNAFLICTDSFHSSVFAILYNRPFIVFDREQEGVANMSSRIDTLISKFHLKHRRFEGKITEENLEHDYTEAYKILEEERKKSDTFLRRALDINE